ncbi:MAG: signal peptidase I [Opitutaceae bacterium]|jgi:signal peptidase I
MNTPIQENSGPGRGRKIQRIFGALWREWICPLLVVGALVLPFKSAIADWEYVPTGSMAPSIVPVELVFVNRLAYDLKLPFTTRHLITWGDPQRGDIVIFYSPLNGERWVKRVIGLPGDLVSMNQERLSINGRPLDYSSLPQTPGLSGDPTHQKSVFAEELLGDRPHPIMIQPQRSALRTFGPVRVPAGSYFLMGDSRDNSEDSRFIGCVDRSRILGRATTIIASVDLDRWGQPRFDRFFTKLP